MQQNYCAVMYSRIEFFERIFSCRLFCIVPIGVGERPKNRGVTEHLRLLNDARKDFVGCEGMIVALDELAANLDNVRSTLCPKEVE